MSAQYQPFPFRIPYWTEFKAMSEEDSVTWCDHVRRLIPSRMTQMQRVIVLDEEYRDWAADFSRESLMGLGGWLAARAFMSECRKYDVEIVGDRPEVTFAKRPAAPTELEPRAESLMLDLGLYLGECMRVSAAGFEWKRCARKGWELSNQLYLGREPDRKYDPLIPIGHRILGAARLGEKVVDLQKLLDVWLGPSAYPWPPASTSRKKS